MQKIKCAKCGEEIEISEAIKHEIEDSVLMDERKKHQDEIKKLEKNTEEKLAKKYEEELNRVKKEKDDDAVRNKELIGQLEKASDEMRLLKRKDEERELEMKKRLMEEEEKIRNDAEKKFREEHQLSDREKERKLTDALNQIEELKTRIKQGSQQAQGETLELELEELLPNMFPSDSIEEIKKGAPGADVRQTVMSPSGQTDCGVILWESKRTKNWTDKWIDKLKEDVRREGANIGVIVSTVLPKDADSEMILRDKVWIVSFKFVVPLATLLRDTLIKVRYQKKQSEHQGKKSDLIYEYITSHQFRQQIESIVESYVEMQDQIVKERLAMERIWKRREGQLTRIINSAAHVYGNLQGLAGGAALPTLKGLDTFELESGENEN